MTNRKRQALAILAVFAYTFTVTWVIAKVLDLTMSIRVAGPVEAKGLDIRLHAENAYENGEDKAHAPRGHAEQLHHLVGQAAVSEKPEPTTR
ncbi:hypothetical protein [Pseudarthrobacter oxydans]|uniref:hypothetical protein n=1 Tax=Pseudarthrobacter oxydans TaxID=1671 RepID=UPI0037FDDBAC